MTERLACFAVTLAVISLLASDAAAAPPVVSNVSASQRTDGSKKVDIYYNVSDPDSAALSVSVKVSADGGATWTVPVTQLSGDFGSSVARGTGKRVVWETCGTDLPGAYGTDYQVAVTATDGPTPGGMIYIPAGSFLMGNNGSEPYSYSAELPQHSVYLSGYWIGKYEVTRGEYRKFMQATGRAAPAYWAADLNLGNGTFTQTESHPVLGVTWYDAEAYCAWAGGHLPTEAQWEKAARWTGSYPNVYPWGNVWDAEKYNNWDDTNPAAGGYGRCQTAPVGSYPSGASPYGCQDMVGNVWEWVADWCCGYYSVSPSTDPQGPSSGIYRGLRGCGWANSGSGDRCAGRSGDYPYSYGGWLGYGFRLAR